MFPNSHETQDAKIARLEAHNYHAWRQINELRAEHQELKKDREALLRYILWRLLISLGLLIGALVSKGSTGGSVAGVVLHALTGSFGG